MGTARTWILLKVVSDMRQHDMLPILKYPDLLPAVETAVLDIRLTICVVTLVNFSENSAFSRTCWISQIKSNFLTFSYSTWIISLWYMQSDIFLVANATVICHAYKHPPVHMPHLHDQVLLHNKFVIMESLKQITIMNKGMLLSLNAHKIDARIGSINWFFQI